METDVASGSLVFNADGSYTYTPNEDFQGQDSFTYSVSDGTHSTTATVDLVVQGESTVIVVPRDEVPVNSTNGGDQDTVRIASLSDGGFVVVWESYGQDTSEDGVYGQRYDANGNAVGGEFKVNTTTSGNQGNPDVTGLSGGGFVVTWHSNGGSASAYDIYGQLYDAFGLEVGGEFKINTTDGSYDLYSRVSALDDGGFVVSWASGNSPQYDIKLQRYASDGTAVGGEITAAANVDLGTSSYHHSTTGCWPLRRRLRRGLGRPW